MTNPQNPPQAGRWPRLLMIFIKNPYPGKVKTRLASDIGEESAVEIYKVLLDYTRKKSLQIRAHRQVWYDDYVNGGDKWRPSRFAKKLQTGNSLGERIQNAFTEAFERGYQKVVIIGSDCPELTDYDLQKAYDKLDNNEIVIGPARDGGYYLLGMTAAYPLFDNIAWSTGSVLDSTLKKIKKQGLQYELLPELGDIDTLEDLRKFIQS